MFVPESFLWKFSSHFVGVGKMISSTVNATGDVIPVVASRKFENFEENFEPSVCVVGENGTERTVGITFEAHPSSTRVSFSHFPVHSEGPNHELWEESTESNQILKITTERETHTPTAGSFLRIHQSQE